MLAENTNSWPGGVLVAPWGEHQDLLCVEQQEVFEQHVDGVPQYF